MADAELSDSAFLFVERGNYIMENTVEKKENQMNEKCKFALGMIAGAGVTALLAYVGIKRFLKTDKAFNLCVNNHFEGYDTIRAIAYPHGIAMGAFNDAGDYKPLADWNVGSNVEALKEFGENIVKMAEAKA